MSSLKCVVGQLSIVEGVRHPQAENILVVSPGTFPHSVRNDYGLYALIELSGLVPPAPDLPQHLLDVLQEEFYSSSGSVSLSLQNALLQVNQALYDFNLNTDRDERQGGGVTCAALRGEALYIAQGGPSVAYLIGQGGMSRLPEHSPWLDEDIDDEDETALRPLGVTRQFAPEITHRQISPGDVFVLTESLLGQVISAEQIEQAVFPGDAQLTAERIADLAEGEDNISLAVIEARLEAEAPFTTPLPHREVEQEIVIDEEPSAQPQILRRSETRRKRTVGHRTSKSRHIEAQSQVQSLLSSIDWTGIQSIVGRALSRIWSWIVAGLSLVFASLKTLIIRILPGSQDIEERRTDRIKKPTMRPRAHTTSRASTSQRGGVKSILASIVAFNLWKYIAVAIPIIVLVIVGLVYMERERAVYQAHEQLIQNARSKYDQALAAMADVDLARSLLADALRKLDDANTILPLATEPPTLRKEILKNIDQLNQVKRLYWIPKLHQYTAANSDLGRIVVDGINVYILDRGANRIFKHVLNETEDGFVNPGEELVLIEQGKQVDDVVVGELLDMNWIPSGGGRSTGNLVILDKAGNLFDYGATWDLKHRPLGGTDEWQYPQAFSGFFGNLYLLDSQRNQILKYLHTPDDGGYANPPLDYIIQDADVDLTGAVDMAIDGYIYILYANGRLIKLMNGAPVPFEVMGLDIPLSSPSAVFTNADQGTQYLYITDRGNKRVVQLTKDGRFQRQFKVDTEAFDDLRSLWIDELEQKMYIVSGNSVFITNLVSE